MSEKKITLEDIAFLISRLTDALEEFSKQIKDTNNIVVADKPKPKVKVNSKEDEEIRRMLEFHAHMARKYGASQKRIDEILNPTHGEFADIDHLISLQTDHRFRGKLTT